MQSKFGDIPAFVDVFPNSGLFRYILKCVKILVLVKIWSVQMLPELSKLNSRIQIVDSHQWFTSMSQGASSPKGNVEH